MTCWNLNCKFFNWRIIVSLKEKSSTKLAAHPEIAFLVLALIFGISLCFLNPIGAGYDETTHLGRAWEISSGHLIPNELLGKGPNFPYVFYEISYRTRTYVETVPPNYFRNNIEKRIDFTNQLNSRTISMYSPILYLPQAFVVGLFGRLLDAPVLIIYYLSRLLELAGYILFTYLAIKIIPFGKWTLTVLALAPMALYQAASISTDPYTNGISFLYIAWILKLSQQEGSVNFRQTGWTVLLTLLLFSAKTNTIFLPILMILIPTHKFQKKSYFYVVLLATLLWFLLFAIGWNLLAYQNYFLNIPGYGMLDQLRFIFTNPGSFISIFFNDLWVHGKKYLVEWIGVYGYWEGIVPPAVYWIYSILLGIVVLLDTALRPIKLKTRLVLIGSFIVGIISTIVFVYLANNKIGATGILSVHGRYFTFIGPLLALGLIPKKPILANTRSLLVPVAATCILSVGVYLIGLYLVFYVPCGKSYYTPGLCYQPEYSNWDPNTEFTQPVVRGEFFSQSFRPVCDPIKVIRLWPQVPTASLDQSTQYAIRDLDTGSIIYSETIPNKNMQDKTWNEIPLPELDWNINHTYGIEISSQNTNPSESLRFSVSSNHDYTRGVFTINSQRVKHDLIFQYGCKIK
jgi:uncharacterized membrane protein